MSAIFSYLSKLILLLVVTTAISAPASSKKPTNVLRNSAVRSRTLPERSILPQIDTPIVLPVRFRTIQATRTQCTINLYWLIEEQQNVSRYEVETSTDGLNFLKACDVVIRHTSEYNASLQITDEFSAPLLFIRLKAIEQDRTFVYSKVVTVEAYCRENDSWNLYAFPNPLTIGGNLGIGLRQALFNGRYIISVIDLNGKVRRSEIRNLYRIQTFSMYVGDLPRSRYLVKITNENGTQAGILEFLKM
ncbi:MAG TPA: hypothetical protein VGD17_11195 [Chitinophagaceae bacterium]